MSNLVRSYLVTHHAVINEVCDTNSDPALKHFAMQAQTLIKCQVTLCKPSMKSRFPSATVSRGTFAHPRTACTHERVLKQKRQLKSWQRLCASSQPDAPVAAVTALTDAPLQQLSGEQTSLPAAAGVYAVYDKHQTLQYVGLSRKVPVPAFLGESTSPAGTKQVFFTVQVAVSIANHMQDLPEHTHSVKVATLSNPTKDNLTAAWKQWVESAGRRQTLSQEVFHHLCLR